MLILFQNKKYTFLEIYFKKLIILLTQKRFQQNIVFLSETSVGVDPKKY